MARVGFVSGKINSRDPVFGVPMVRVGVVDEDCVYGSQQLMAGGEDFNEAGYLLQKIFSDLMSARGEGPRQRSNVKDDEDG